MAPLPRRTHSPCPGLAPSMALKAPDKQKNKCVERKYFSFSLISYVYAYVLHKVGQIIDVEYTPLVVLLRFDIHFVYILYINDQGLPVIIALSKPQMLCFMVKLNFV